MNKPEFIETYRDALVEEWVRWQVAREQRATARANVQAGNYTNGTPMSRGDRAIYRRLTQAAFVSILFVAVLIGAMTALAVVGK